MGIVGLAIALAAQNLLSNVFGGVTITIDQLYKKGDRVEMAGVYGDVYDIKPRYTRIKTLNNTLITIPNAKVINEQIINYSVPDSTVRVKIPVGVAYGTDPKKVDEILLDIANQSKLVLKEPKSLVRFTECASSSQNFELIVWVKHYDDKHPVVDHVFREIYLRFKKEGIEIPFNQMDIHIKTHLLQIPSKS
jgi:small-conductance mechanosensitive channel